ncbi:MAG: hypothetical protein ACYCST_11525 [Acidimicrobiales bacterium]
MTSIRAWYWTAVARLLATPGPALTMAGRAPKGSGDGSCVVERAFAVARAMLAVSTVDEPCAARGATSFLERSL